MASSAFAAVSTAPNRDCQEALRRIVACFRPPDPQRRRRPVRHADSPLAAVAAVAADLLGVPALAGPVAGPVAGPPGPPHEGKEKRKRKVINFIR